MNFTQESVKKSGQDLDALEDVIAKAVKKVRGTKENDLCKYIPMSSGGYMHHFTLRKMKFKSPKELNSLIEKFIIKTDRPMVIPPKQRATRGSRKKKDHLNFSKLQLERLLNMARLSGDKEMISVLSPKKSLAHSKRELIQAVRQGVIDQEYWDAYVEAINNQQAMIAAGAEIMAKDY